MNKPVCICKLIQPRDASKIIEEDCYCKPIIEKYGINLRYIKNVETGDIKFPIEFLNEAFGTEFTSEQIYHRDTCHVLVKFGSYSSLLQLAFSEFPPGLANEKSFFCLWSTELYDQIPEIAPNIEGSYIVTERKEYTKIFYCKDLRNPRTKSDTEKCKHRDINNKMEPEAIIHKLQELISGPIFLFNFLFSSFISAYGFGSEKIIFPIYTLYNICSCIGLERILAHYLGESFFEDLKDFEKVKLLLQKTTLYLREIPREQHDYGDKTNSLNMTLYFINYMYRNHDVDTIFKELREYGQFAYLDETLRKFLTEKYPEYLQDRPKRRSHEAYDFLMELINKSCLAGYFKLYNGHNSLVCKERLTECGVRKERYPRFKESFLTDLTAFMELAISLGFTKVTYHRGYDFKSMYHGRKDLVVDLHNKEIVEKIRCVMEKLYVNN